MIPIKIALRLHPFSKQPGTTLMLPGSALGLQIFPTILRIYDLSRNLAVGEVKFSIQGPVRDFTIVQDLERCEVRVFGHASEGHFRYICKPADKFCLQVDKGNIAFESQSQAICKPTDKFCLQIEKGNIAFESHSQALGGTAVLPNRITERLSLGCHKAQDWSSMQRRLLLEELFPLWLKLGALTPECETSLEGTGHLLQHCREAIEQRDKEAILPAFQNLFMAAFSGLFVPRLVDEQDQGFSLPPVKTTSSPLFILTEGARLIRSLFVQQTGDSVSILLALPPKFHAGRLIGVACPPFGLLDLEWTKKQVRRLILHSDFDGEVRFNFPRELKMFRLSESTTRRKEQLPCSSPFAVEKGKSYHLDRFQK